MIKPRTFVKLSLCLALSAAAVSLSVETARGQQPTAPASTATAAAPAQAAAPDDLMRGLELYKQGDDKGAIAILRSVVKKNKTEVAAWYGLALAYMRQGKTGDARKAYEKAAMSGEWLVEQIYTSFAYEEVPAQAEKYRALLTMAEESCRQYLALSPKASRSKVEEWTSRAEFMHDYIVLAEERRDNPGLNRIYRPQDVVTKARIINRPEPQYTEGARSSQVVGTVVIRAVFAFDGRVRGIRVIKGLPKGLTLAAVRAARQIKFIPASVNGKPVSQYIQIEYNFNLY